MTATSLAAGALFGSDFEIVRPLSSGGMGSVYVALQRSTGKQRALKLMLSQLVANPDLRRRFDQEARIASLIKSDHVVEVVGAGVDDATGVPWLAMELLEGTDLDSTIAVRGPMTLTETRRVLEQLCHAVAAAHDAGIIHRDLKPENVFLARASSAHASQVVKVLDFGIAKIAAEATTKHTGAMGSPLWMAPEQTERGGITPAADVWALGLITFFLLTGKPFWLSAAAEGSSVQQIMREVLFDPLPRASERAAHHGVAVRLPVWFDEWFARCVNRDPKARFASGGEVFARFDAECASVDGSASQVTAPYAPAGQVVVRSATPPAAASSPGLALGSTSPTGPTVIDASAYSSAGLGAATKAEPPRMVTAVPHVRARPGIVVAGACTALLALGFVGLGLVRGAPATPAAQARSAPQALAGLPDELARTKGAAWFAKVRARCNPVEVDLLVSHEPPPRTKDGAGFAAACFTLAGKLDRARASLDAVPGPDRPYAAWAVFEVVHPIADAGDDPSAGPAMRLVLDYWPEHYMALYHAGMAEYRAGEPARARVHLRHFLELYKNPDGFNAAAKKVLAALDAPTTSPDCETPLAVDPEGQKTYRAGCLPRR